MSEEIAKYPALSQQPNEANVTFPSDNLRSLYELCEKYPSFAKLFGMGTQIRFVIDTNIVLDELLFVTTKRGKDSARTALREVLDSGLAITIAPTKLHEEVNRHIPRLALERSVPEEAFRQAWVELQTQIEFRDVKENPFPGQSLRDPDDIPFLELYLSSGVDAVLTRDKDIAAMGAKALGPEVLRPMRDYARAKSPEVSLRIGGVVVVGIPVVSLVAVLKVLATALRSFRNLRPELQLLLLGGVVLAVFHPTTRKALSAGVSSLAIGLKSSAGIFGEVFGEVALKIVDAQLELKAKQTVVEALIPTARLSPAKAGL
jgi:predicted nucleic acid-binding protein